MLGLPSIAMIGFGLAALATRHWRCRIHRAARRNAISTNQVHLALDPERWADHGENAHAKDHSHSARRKTVLRKAGLGDRFWERMADESLETQEQSEAEFVSINPEPQDSSLRAAQRRQAFRVISNA
jgi:hypothetical protein